jgi:hypothetical protein
MSESGPLPPSIMTTTLTDLRLGTGTPVLMLLCGRRRKPAEWLTTTLSARPARTCV